MRAIGHVKHIPGKGMFELFEIKEREKLRHFEMRIDFIDYPNGIIPNEGDMFTSWYWVPLRIVNFI